MSKGLVFTTVRRIAYLLYVSILLILCSPAFSASAMPLPSAGQRITEFRYIHDPDNRLDPQSALSQFKQGQYQTVLGETFNIGNSDDVFWVLFSVFNDSAEPKVRQAAAARRPATL